MQKTFIPEVKYSAQKDAWAYVKQSASFASNIDTILEKFLPQDIFSKLKSDSSQKEKTKIIENHLQTFFKNNKEKFNIALQKFNNILQNKMENIIDELEKIYQIKLNYKKIVIYMTTFPRCPYNYKEKWFMVNIFENQDNQITTVKHELNHFFFHKKFGAEERKIGFENFHRIKEAFTVISLPNERGYSKHQNIRKNIKKWFDEGKTTEAMFNLAYEQIKNGG